MLLLSIFSEQSFPSGLITFLFLPFHIIIYRLRGKYCQQYDSHHNRDDYRMIRHMDKKHCGNDKKRTPQRANKFSPVTQIPVTQRKTLVYFFSCLRTFYMYDQRDRHTDGKDTQKDIKQLS